MGNRIMQVELRCQMSGKAVIRMDRHCAMQERSLLWSIPRLGSVSASIASEGDVKQKTGER